MIPKNVLKNKSRIQVGNKALRAPDGGAINHKEAKNPSPINAPVQLQIIQSLRLRTDSGVIYTGEVVDWGVQPLRQIAAVRV